MAISILGAGAWGTAIAISLSSKKNVILWTRNETAFESINLFVCILCIFIYIYIYLYMLCCTCNYDHFRILGSVECENKL